MLIKEAAYHFQPATINVFFFPSHCLSEKVRPRSKKGVSNVALFESVTRLILKRNNSVNVLHMIESAVVHISHIDLPARLPFLLIVWRSSPSL